MHFSYKNKFGIHLLVFFSDIPEIRETDLAVLKSHGEQEVSDKDEKKIAEAGKKTLSGGTESLSKVALDVSSLVNKTNDILKAHEEELQALSPEFRDLFHDEIVQYFLTSPDRYDKNLKPGLSVEEFTAYRTDMLAKIDELVKQYAPTDAEKEQMEQTRVHAEKAAKEGETIKPVSFPEIAEHPGEISDLQRLGEKFQTYDFWNASLQKESGEAMQAVAVFQNEYAAFQRARAGISAYKKIGEYFLSARDEVRVKLETQLAVAKEKIAAIRQKCREAKERLEKYGAALRAVSNHLKQKALTERDEKLKGVDEKFRGQQGAKRRMEKKYAVLQTSQDKLIKRHTELEEYEREVTMEKAVFADRAERGATKQKSLNRYSDILGSASTRIDQALKNPSLGPEQREKLLGVKKNLAERSFEALMGLKMIELEREGTKQKQTVLDEEDKKIGEKSVDTLRHLNEQVRPSLSDLQSGIAVLEDSKMQYATSREQVIAHFDATFQSFDAVDKNIDDAVLKNNLANAQSLSQLESQQKMVEQMEVERPSGMSGFFEATIGIPFAVVSGVLGSAGEWILHQAEELSKELERNRDEMGTLSYVLARGAVELVSIPIGVAGGLFEMGSGLVSMVGHPIETLKGIGSLVGLNPAISAGQAWKAMGKAIIMYDEFKEGHIGLAIGKIFPNVVITIETMGAAQAGKIAATAVYAQARAAGISAARAMAKAGVAFARGAGGEIATSGKEVAKFIVGGKGKANILVRTGQGIKALPGAVRVIPEIPKAVWAGMKAGGETLAAQTERLWGGTKFENVRIRGFAGKEAALVDDLGKSAERYQEYEKALQKAKDKDPGLSDAEAALKLSEENPSLFLDAAKHREKLQKLEEAQKAFDDAVKSGMKSPENAQKAQALLDAKNLAQKGMVDAAADFAELKKALAGNDHYAVEAAREFEKVLALDHPEAIAAWKAEYFPTMPPAFQKAFTYMEHRRNFGGAERELRVLQLLDSMQAIADHEPNLFRRIGELAKRASSDEEMALLDDALAVLYEEGKVRGQVILIPIAMGKIVPNPRLIRTFIDAGDGDLRQLCQMNITFTELEQTRILEKILPGAEPGLDPTLLGRMIKEGKINSEVPEVAEKLSTIEGVNALMQTPTGYTLAQQLIAAGKAPLTHDLIENLMATEKGIGMLDDFLKNPAIRLEGNIAREELVEALHMEVRKQRVADVKSFRELRSKTPEQLEAFKDTVRRGIQHLERSDAPVDRITEILSRLKQYDPDGYAIVASSDAGRLVDTDCLDAIIAGHKGEFIDANGQEVIAYIGKDIAKGGMGKVAHVVTKAENGEIAFAVLKKPHEGKAIFRETFDEELNAARAIQSWDHPNIIRPLYMTDDFIIYETSEIAKDLAGSLGELSPDEYFRMLRQTIDGLLEYQRRGKFHGDLKDLNVLRMKIGESREGYSLYGAKIIDNNPVDYHYLTPDSLRGMSWIRTPLYSFKEGELITAYKKLRASGIPEAEVIPMLGRAIDARAYGMMLQEALDHYDPQWLKNKEISQLVKTLMDPVKAGQPGVLESAASVIDKIITRFEDDAHRVGNAPVRNVTISPSPTMKEVRKTERDTLPENQSYRETA